MYVYMYENIRFLIAYTRLPMVDHHTNQQPCSNKSHFAPLAEQNGNQRNEQSSAFPARTVSKNVLCSIQVWSSLILPLLCKKYCLKLNPKNILLVFIPNNANPTVSRPSFTSTHKQLLVIRFFWANHCFTQNQATKADEFALLCNSIHLFSNSATWLSFT